MQKILRLSAVLITCLTLAQSAIGEEAVIPATVILNKYPVLNNDALKQILFSASLLGENYNPSGINWELHNPFRDKTIAGIVVTVEYKLPTSDKPTVLEVFIRVDCGPLQSASGREGCFKAEEAAKASPTIKLKEVHYAPDNP